jgi:transposase
MPVSAPHRPARARSTIPKALVVNAPERLREQLRTLATDQLLPSLRWPAQATQPSRSKIAPRSPRCTAPRSLALPGEADDLHAELDTLVRRRAPWLLTEPGIGVICAAQLLNAWSHAAGCVRRPRSPCSAGQRRSRHRPTRSCVIASTAAVTGSPDRALHTIALSRMADHAQTRAYVARRIAEGKTAREIQRCRKRYLARRLFKLLEASPAHAQKEKTATT